MDPQDIRNAIQLLKNRVTLTESAAGDCQVTLEDLDRDGMVALGIAPDLAQHLASADWWPEMIEDVGETPDFCEPDTSPDEILKYARDVIFEYVAKRL